MKDKLYIGLVLLGFLLILGGTGGYEQGTLSSGEFWGLVLLGLAMFGLPVGIEWWRGRRC